MIINEQISKISDKYIGRNQEPQFLNGTESSRLKISDKRKLRNIGFDSDAIQKIADDSYVNGETTLTPPESPTKQSLLPWKVTSRSATPRNDYPSESIESPHVPASPHNQNFVFDQKVYLDACYL